MNYNSQVSQNIRVWGLKEICGLSVTFASLSIKIKIDKFGDFSSDIVYSSRTDVFMGIIYLIID